MIRTAVLGASGFAGQETLDRVLAHPELELVALGSDSLAGESADALDPRLSRNGHGPLPAFVSNDEALAAGAELVFVTSTTSSSRPPTPSSSTSPARTASTRRGRTRCPSSSRPPAALIANPGCYATAALLALAPIAGIVDPGERRRRRQVRHLRRRAAR